MGRSGVKDALGSADVASVPIQTRCPSCGAAIPVAASWCSLCHTDLRPRTVTPTAPVVLPGTPAPLPTGSIVAPVPATGSTLTDAPRGRHSAGRAVEPSTDGNAAEPAPAGRRSRVADRPQGRHASGGRAAAPSRELASLEPVELPATDAVTPEEVDAIADRMISRLAIVEERPRLLDPDDLPGGKWGLIGGGMVAVILVLLAVGSLAVLITNR